MPRSSIVQFPLSSGFDEGADPKQLPPGRLLSLCNAEWTKDGRLDKRAGTRSETQSIVGGGSLSAAARLFARGDELCIADGSNLYALTSTGWKLRENFANVGLTWKTAIDHSDGMQASDVGVTTDGQIIHAWSTGDPTTGTGGTVFWQRIDRTNDARTTTPIQLDSSGSTKIRVLTSGTDWIILWTEGVNLKCSVNGNTLVTLRTDTLGSGAAFDACIIGSLFVVAYALTGGGISIRSWTIAATPVLQTSGTVTGETTTSIPAISIDGDAGDTLYIGYMRGTATVAFRLAAANPTTFVQTLAPMNVESGSSYANMIIAVKRLDASSCVYAYSTESGSAGATWQDGVTITKKITSAGVVSGERRTFNTCILSRPFLMNGTPHMFLANFGNSTGMLLSSTNPVIQGLDSFLVAIETNTLPIYIYPHRLVGKVDVLISGNWTRGFHANVAAISATEFMTVLPYQATAMSGITGWRQATRFVTITTGASRPADLWRAQTYGQEAYLAGGVFQAYDGRLVFDYGMAHWAYVEQLTASGAGGVMGTGTYLYSCVPEYRSAAGVMHRGPAATPQSVAVTGPTGSVAVKLIPVHLSYKSPSSQAAFGVDPARVLLTVYRSLANVTVLQRLTVEPQFSTVYQQSGTSPQTLNDTYADTNIGHSSIKLGQRPVLYTTGGILDDYQPPASTTLKLHGDRLWIVTGDLRTVWFSKSFQDDLGVAPGFNPALRLSFDGDLVGLESMNENLVVFSEGRIWAVQGEGPAPNGDGSTLRVIPVQSDMGCTNPRSLVGTPLGVFFQAPRGLMLLTRGFELQWVGKPIQDRLAAFPNITSAVHIPAKNQVRFSCNNAGGTAGIVLVFDYARGQWSRNEYYDSVSGVSGVAITDAILFRDAYTFVTATGKVYAENAATYLDDGTQWVAQSWELADISASGPLGFQRVRRAFIRGDRFSDADVTLAFAFDGDAAFVQSWTWRSDKLAEFADGANVGMRVGAQNGANPRCRAFRARFSDAAPTGPGAVVGVGRGVNVSAVGLEIVPKPEMDRRSARARA